MILYDNKHKKNHMQIDHIAIWTNDLEKEKTFFQTYFDCKANDKYENMEKQFASYFLTFSNGIRIELMRHVDKKVKDNTNKFGFSHVAINVGTRDKVDSLTKKLEKDGFIIDSYPRVTGDGYYESVILDPENNEIELTSIEDYKIYEAKNDDLEKILYLQKTCYLSEAEIYGDYSISPLTQTLEDLKREFERLVILKLVYRNRIIGSIRGFAEEGTCYIGKLIVDKEFQNMGFGKQLMLEIENKFNGIIRYELFTGFQSSKNLYLYEKLGYKEFKQKKVNTKLTLKYLEKIVSH